MEEHQRLTPERRKDVIRRTFISQMKKIYRPHKHLIDNKSEGVYLDQMAEIINEKLPVADSEEHLLVMIRKSYDHATSKNDTNFYFSLAQVIKSCTHVAQEHYKTHIAPFEKQTRYIESKHDEERGRKDDPTSQGWTIAGAQKQIEYTQELMDTGQLPKRVGEMLIRIPQKALERIQQRETSNG